MKRVTLLIAFIFLCGLTIPSLRAGDQPDARRSKDQILADINAVKVPEVDKERSKDQAYMNQYVKDRSEALKKRAELTAQLYKLAPDAEELNKLLPQRWDTAPGGPARTVAEIDDYLAAHPNSSITEEAATLRAQVQIHFVAKTTADRLAAVEHFKKYATTTKGNELVPTLLYSISRMTKDEKEKKELTDRILKEYPNSRAVAMIEGNTQMAEAVGKPMVLAFNDAITGKPLSIEGLKGKVVVMEFWAAWCSDCIAEMPAMKKIYAEYKSKGVEFIGVSLDKSEADGGLKALKEFCAKNEITWSQYYQGNFWDSEFSTRWGIFSIPCVFVIGPDGKIVTTQGLGNLETILPEQIKKRDEKVAGE